MSEMVRRPIPHSATTLGDAEVEAAARVLRSGHLSQGSEVASFEEECAAVVGRRHAVALNSGTSALHLALGALGVEDGETVAVPSYGCASLITAVRLQRAEPSLCDIGEALTLDSRAVPVSCRVSIQAHLFGARGPMPAGTVIEDIAQSFGGTTGRTGQIAVASFYATKLLTTGEGGVILTDDEGVAEFVRDRRDYDNRNDFVGRYNYKLTDLQAAIGRVQLQRLPSFLERRREIALAYHDAFRGLPVAVPDPADHVFFRYVLRTERRDALEAHLHRSGIEAKRPVYRPAHHYLGGEYPNSERAHRECLSLPIYPSLIDAEARHVIDSVCRFFE
ncbi:MAG: DegT/DnrJ/EryC1/StrS family aminotransferase [Candidatus Hydrogenedentes bacterium]|nr:DegT/DnrJ/EryC1/StrS family aminotransferase [Candidatus Hydrogenedentota bacterium]